MKTAFRASFVRDLGRIQDRSVLDRIRRVIEEVERASDTQAIAGLRKLSGSGAYFRIRVRDYRLGLAISGDEMESVRCLHRRDIYRFFP